MRTILLVLLSAFLIFSCTVTYKPELVQHIKGSSFKPTQTGYYTAELVMKSDPPVVGKNQANLIIHNYRAHDIPGLTITVTPVLPGSSVTSPSTPSVKDVGRGLYVIDDIEFPVPGDWKLAIKIEGPDMNDVVTLDIPTVVEAVTPQETGGSEQPSPTE